MSTEYLQGLEILIQLFSQVRDKMSDEAIRALHTFLDGAVYQKQYLAQLKQKQALLTLHRAVIEAAKENNVTLSPLAADPPEDLGNPTNNMDSMTPSSDDKDPTDWVDRPSIATVVISDEWQKVILEGLVTIMGLKITFEDVQPSDVQ